VFDMTNAPRTPTNTPIAQEDAVDMDTARDKDFEVIVNTKKHRVEEPQIDFDSVVKLAYPTSPTPTSEYTVTYRHGPHQNPQGALYPGQSVIVKNEMVFNVTPTNKS